jgi:hypothetical protein
MHAFLTELGFTPPGPLSNCTRASQFPIPSVTLVLALMTVCITAQESSQLWVACSTKVEAANTQSVDDHLPQLQRD